MRKRSACGLALLVLAGCGGDDEPPSTPAAGPEGKQLVRQSGCLACHRIGGEGNDGPGADLDGIGSRLSKAEIARALVESEQPMPSYADLPESDRNAITDYLASLR